MEQIKYIHHTMSIVNGTDKRTYANCYTDGFISELNNLNEGTITAAEFIKRYGTHIVWSVDYGQTLDYVIKFHVDVADENEFFALADDAFIDGIKNSDYAKKYGESYTFRHHSRGCQIIDSVTTKFFSEDKKTVAVNTQHVIIGYGDRDDGLVPIWEILPDEYADSATLIEAEYNKQYAEFEKKIEEELAKRRAAEDEAKAYFAEKEAAAGEAIKKALSEQSEEKGCASSFNSSWMLFLIPCVVTVLLVKKKINI